MWHSEGRESGQERIDTVLKIKEDRRCVGDYVLGDGKAV